MFSFLRFKIKQNDQVFKITTDSLVLAGLCTIKALDSRVLDVGTGTGVLALLLKDRYPNISVDGIDIQEEAINLANENKRLFHSPTGLHFAFSTLDQCADNSYDLIISNPPYFDRRLESPKPWKTLSRHQTNFDLEEFFVEGKKKLRPDGKIEMIYPFLGKSRLENACQNARLSVQRRVLVKDNSTASPKIVFVSITRNSSELIEEEIILKDASGRYSREYKELLKGWVNWDD